MGAEQSRVGVSPKDALGLHVLRVAEGSPCSDTLDVWWDYIVGIGGQRVTEDTDRFTEAIELCENRKITLQVWSAKRQELRDVPIVPNRKWSTSVSSPTPDEEPSLLGVSLRLCKVDSALDRVWHVLDVLDGSPAQDAGLVPFTDYIIGSASGVLRNEGDFFNLVEQSVEKSLRLFVWNADLDVLRQVIIVPNRNWGTGQGLLGAGIGFGLLHRIPKPSDRPPVLEELDLPEDGEDEQTAELHVAPADDDDDGFSDGVSVVPASDIPPQPRFDARAPGRSQTMRSAIMEEA